MKDPIDLSIKLLSEISAEKQGIEPNNRLTIEEKEMIVDYLSNVLSENKEYQYFEDKIHIVYSLLKEITENDTNINFMLLGHNNLTKSASCTTFGFDIPEKKKNDLKEDIRKFGLKKILIK